jgi:hypothetical protein
MNAGDEGKYDGRSLWRTGRVGVLLESPPTFIVVLKSQ